MTFLNETESTQNGNGLDINVSSRIFLVALMFIVEK